MVNMEYNWIQILIFITLDFYCCLYCFFSFPKWHNKQYLRYLCDVTWTCFWELVMYYGSLTPRTDRGVLGSTPQSLSWDHCFLVHSYRSDTCVIYPYITKMNSYMLLYYCSDLQIVKCDIFRCLITRKYQLTKAKSFKLYLMVHYVPIKYISKVINACNAN